MDLRLGVGPVFVYECLTAARRWQVYATRALYVGLLLAVLALTWWTEFDSAASVRKLAAIGESFFYTIASIELIAVLLVAPAATAGTICLDRNRGTLAHMMMTDLSSAEIVLGKLAARLLPTLALIAAALPMLALTTLLGGIDPVALLGATMVAVGVAVVGSSLAIVLSIWGRKPHEVLMATYAAMLGWVLFDPILNLLSDILAGTRRVVVPEWLGYFDPFWVAFAPYWEPGWLGLGTQTLFLLACLSLAAGVAALATARVRRVAFRGEQRRRGPGRLRRALARFLEYPRWWQRPSLDGNPVLWRQWHYARPSTWMGVLWGVFTALSLGMAGLVIAAGLNGLGPGGGVDESVILIDLFYVFIGLLFVSLNAPITLAEERTRGSLDVLLATPLRSSSIVWAKWWGVYRAVPPLAILPGIVQLSLANPERHWAGFFLSTALLLSSGAAVTSWGLAMALWTPRLGRAVGLSVGCYVALTLGSFFAGSVVETIARGPRDGIEYGLGVMAGGPAFGVGLIAGFSAERLPPNAFSPDLNARWAGMVNFGIGWAILHATFAVALLGLVLLTFDRCLGRIAERRATVPWRPAAGRPRRPVAVEARAGRLQGAAN